MLSFSLSLPTVSHLQVSCPVMLIYSVYLRALITENGRFHFSRQRLGVEGLTSICLFLLTVFSELVQGNNNYISLS